MSEEFHVKSILVIDMQSYHAECSQCGAYTNDKCGLPVDDTGEVVANDYEGEWGGVPACRRCFDVHAAGGPDALRAMLEHDERGK